MTSNDLTVTDRDGRTVTVAVDLWDPVKRQRGHQRFTLTVAPAGGSETGGNR